MLIYDKSRMTDVFVVGGKGIGLSKLTLYGLNVPDFFVVAAGTDLYSEDFVAELDAFATILNCQSFAVRSSSINEDMADGSYAGQYSTKLDVKRENLLEAVRAVALSFENSSVKNYSDHFEKQTQNIAVIVQKQLYGEFSGVMFTTSPYSDEERIIECVRGGGEKLVGGLVNPLKLMVIKKGDDCAEGFYGKLCNAATMLEKGEGFPLDVEWTSDGIDVWFLQMRPLTAIGDCIPPIPNVKWNMYVYRDFCRLVHSVQCIASHPSVQIKAFGFTVPIKEGLIVNGREFYSEESDRQFIETWRSLDCENFFTDFIKRLKHSVYVTRKRTNRLKNINCLTLSNEQLFSLFRSEIKAYIRSYIPLLMRPDDYLFTKLSEMVGKDRAERIAVSAAIINKKTYYSSERSDFLKSVISEDMQGYIDKYEWIINPLAKKAVPITKERYLKRTAGLTISDAREKLQAIEKSHKRDFEYRKSVINELDEKERELFEAISEFIFLRTYTAENSDRYFYYIRKNILGVLGQRLNISEDVLLLMSVEELLKTAKGFKLSPQEISKRKSGELIIIRDGICNTFYSGKSYAILKSLQLDASDFGCTVLEGKIACMGEVRGRVKIVNNLEQAEEFEDGCILVTTMTVPEITSALDKACGIITDEGGITCHAAIIAREYAIPCLVGTKNATSVLRDDMVVNLDCINGKVTLD